MGGAGGADAIFRVTDWLGAYSINGLQGLGILLFLFALYLIFSYFSKRLVVEKGASKRSRWR